MVIDGQRSDSPRLWISYPWTGREEKDFSCLVPQLKDAHVEAVYDSLELLPDSRLWHRIMQRLMSLNFDGWAYVLTHQVLARGSCAGELSSAIQQALLHKGSDFPMVGLLHGISAQSVPAVLRVRPCLSLGDPDWMHQVSNALQRCAPHEKQTADREATRFVWSVYPCYGGDPSVTAIEVRARSDSIPFWRFAIPKSVRTVRCGMGVAGGGEICPLGVEVVQGTGKYIDSDITWFGADLAVSDTASAYVLFTGPLPEFVCFGPSKGPLGPPGNLEIFWTAAPR